MTKLIPVQSAKVKEKTYVFNINSGLPVGNKKTYK